MIRIYAETYMIATRTDGLNVSDVTRPGYDRKGWRRLFRKPTKQIDPKKL